jgi:mRNA interferase RelE/StbE
MNGQYAVSIIPRALNGLEKLDRHDRDRIRARIDDLAATPRPPGCIKLSGPENLWRIRVGSYRVIYEIDDPRRLIVVVIVAHRRESYRGL